MTSNNSSLLNMDPSITALRVRRLMELEGCFFSRHLTTKVMPHMGGGVGVIASHLIQPDSSGSTNKRKKEHLRDAASEMDNEEEMRRARGEAGLLIRVPFRTMITVGKARMHLAIVEAEYERQYALYAQSPLATASAPQKNKGGGPVPPFTVRFYNEAEPESEATFRHMCGCQVPPSSFHANAENDPLDNAEDCVLSDAHVHHLRQMESKLAASLTPAETLAAYVALQAALHGRLEYDQLTTLPEGASTPTDEPAPRRGRKTATSAAGGSSSLVKEAGRAELQRLVEEGRHRIHFVHDNAWMREWIHALPPLYDNALELQYQRPPRRGFAVSGAAVGAPPKAPHALPLEVRQQLFGFSRFENKVLKEQERAYATYIKCLGVLRCLRCLPVGVDLSRTTVSTSTTNESTHKSHECSTDSKHKASSPSGSLPMPTKTGSRGTGPISFPQFLWCLNTVASRGFGFPLDVWAMMPYVDYFNYALQSNAWMGPVKDESAVMRRRKLDKEQRKKFGGRKTASSLRAAPWSMMNPLSRAEESASDYYFAFKALCPIAKEEQIFLCYGSYSDVELLLWYGFTLRPFLLPLSCIPYPTGHSSTRNGAEEAAEAGHLMNRGPDRVAAQRASALLTYSTTKALLSVDVSSGEAMLNGTNMQPNDRDDNDEYDELGFLKERGESRDVVRPAGLGLEQEQEQEEKPESRVQPSIRLFPSPCTREEEQAALVAGLEVLLGNQVDDHLKHTPCPASSESRSPILPQASSQRCGQGLDRVFRTWVREQREHSPSPAAATVAWSHSRHAKEKEKWCSALQTCFTFVYSPLENIEGEWDSDDDADADDDDDHGDEQKETYEGVSHVTTGQKTASWLHRLVSAYLHDTLPLTLTGALEMVTLSAMTRGDTNSLHHVRSPSSSPCFTFLTMKDATNAVALDDSVRRFVATVLAPILGLSSPNPSGATPARTCTKSSTIIIEKESYCGFGCLHPTSDMRTLLRSLSRSVSSCPRLPELTTSPRCVLSSDLKVHDGREKQSAPTQTKTPSPRALNGTSELEGSSDEHGKNIPSFSGVGFALEDVSRAVQVCYAGCCQGSTADPKPMRMDPHSRPFGKTPSVESTAEFEIGEGVNMVQLLRALCWMEWYHEACRNTSRSMSNSTTGSTTMSTSSNPLLQKKNGAAVPSSLDRVDGMLRGTLSMCAVRRAVQVADDGAALLYCLALRLSVPTLLRYLMVVDTGSGGKYEWWNEKPNKVSTRSLPRWIHDITDNEEEDSDVEL